MSMDATHRIELYGVTISAGDAWRRVPLVSGIVGMLGVVASVALGRGEAADQLYFSWLVAFLFFLSIALGAMFFVLVHFVCRAGWGVAVRRLSENVMATVPLFAALFVPVAAGMHHLFHWTDAEAVAHDALLQSKAPYLNTSFFFVRAAVYFTCWTVIALVYYRGSCRQDDSGDESITRRLTARSGPAIVLYAVTVSFAAIDWIMSLDPHWYSTIFGVYYFSGALVGTFSFTVLIAVALRRAGYLRHAVTVEHFHDLGKLLFAFSLFWAYIAFSQFFLIWYANLPEETVWYMRRLEGSWKALTIVLALGHFAVPFFFLMSRTIKRHRGLLVIGAIWMLLIHLLDIYWLVMPVLHAHGVRPALLDLTTLVGIGGLFFALFGWLLTRRALVPMRDPRLMESLSLENF